MCSVCQFPGLLRPPKSGLRQPGNRQPCAQGRTPAGARRWPRPTTFSRPGKPPASPPFGFQGLTGPPKYGEALRATAGHRRHGLGLRPAPIRHSLPLVTLRRAKARFTAYCPASASATQKNRPKTGRLFLCVCHRLRAGQLASLSIRLCTWQTKECAPLARVALRAPKKKGVLGNTLAGDQASVPQDPGPRKPPASPPFGFQGIDPAPEPEVSHEREGGKALKLHRARPRKKPAGIWGRGAGGQLSATSRRSRSAAIVFRCREISSPRSITARCSLVTSPVKLLRWATSSSMRSSGVCTSL